MKNQKTIRSNIVAKFFSSLVFVASAFCTIFCIACIFFLTLFNAFDSSRNAAINTMRDVLYESICRNYCDDAIELCVFGNRNPSFFNDTNFRFRVVTDTGLVMMESNGYSSQNGLSIMERSFSYPVEYRIYATDPDTLMQTLRQYDDYSVTEGETAYEGVGILTKTYTIKCYVDSQLQYSDQFSFINDFVTIIYDLRFVVILAAIAGVLLSIMSFVFLMAAAGYHENSDGPTLIWFDKIFFEFIPLALFGIGVLELLILDEFGYLSFSAVICLGFMILFDLIVLLASFVTLAARFRCRSFWKTTLIFTILRGIFLLFKKLFNAFVKLASYIPSIWRVVVSMCVVLLVEFILLLASGYEALLCIFIIEKLVLIPVAIYYAIVLQKLEATGNKIANGDMNTTIDTTFFFGTARKQGQNLNNIKLGISNAVEDKMKSERFKTELITNVSHDIKTPLTSIVNYVDLLSKEDLQNETAKEYIEIISKHSNRLKNLVVDLVDASKASSGVIQLNMSPMNIDVLLEQIAGEYSEKLMSNNLDLIMRKPDESIQIMADGQRLYRVFDNMMNNIYKYALSGTRVYLLLEKTNDKAVISFKNISATELDMSAGDLMERFVRGDKSRNTEGSGLGLSIAESLVTLQKGEFNIQLDGDLFKVVITFPILEGGVTNSKNNAMNDTLPT